jgi:MFS family permease
MTARRLKLGYFVLEGLNTYATGYYSGYVFFHMRREFGFTARDNLLLAALYGFVYMLCAWFAGRFAQRRGYFTALRVGFGTMGLAVGGGGFLPWVWSQCAVMMLWTFGMSFTWATLEALVSEGESRVGLSQILGIYNVVWAAGAALAYFSGGALLETLGRRSLFWLPAGIHVLQLGLTFWLERKAAGIKQAGTSPNSPPNRSEPDAHPLSAEARRFPGMAWLANPFAYIAINTVIPLVPELAARLGLSTTLAGFVASTWMFGRFFAFATLWRWAGWHYRFGWLGGAYAGMVLCFAALLLVPNLVVMLLAQLGFGLAVGLIYYSSLFYSMDLGEAKGEHGGVHEALIGLGTCAGPATGAAALLVMPASANASAWAVSGLLLLGLAGLVWKWRRPEQPPTTSVAGIGSDRSCG